jgi:hypothetical protein
MLVRATLDSMKGRVLGLFYDFTPAKQYCCSLVNMVICVAVATNATLSHTCLKASGDFQ